MITKPNCTCGKAIGLLAIKFKEEKAKLDLIDGDLPPLGQILDDLGLDKRCCRATLMSGRYFNDFLNLKK